MNLSDELGLTYSLDVQKKLKALIHFTSWRSDMTKVYAGLDIVTLTSLNEGTPVTLIEAQASNKPIVSTDVGGVRDILEEGVTGLLSPSNDMESFVNNLVNVIEKKELRESMGAAGYTNVFEKFSYRRLVGDVRSLYETLIYEKK
jgi:glycosyltransferase involved in cell wall biosynthesis